MPKRPISIFPMVLSPIWISNQTLSVTTGPFLARREVRPQRAPKRESFMVVFGLSCCKVLIIIFFKSERFGKRLFLNFYGIFFIFQGFLKLKVT